MPGILHGNEDMLYGVYLNGAKQGTEEDPDTFELAMITRDAILEAAKAPEGEFRQLIFTRSECFGVATTAAVSSALLLMNGKNHLQ